MFLKLASNVQNVCRFFLLLNSIRPNLGVVVYILNARHVELHTLNAIIKKTEKPASSKGPNIDYAAEPKKKSERIDVVLVKTPLPEPILLSKSKNS